MKTQFIYRTLIVLILALVTSRGLPQDFKGGTVKYIQTIKYDFAKIFNIDPNAGGKGADWIASLPTEMKMGQILCFTPEKALYREDPGVTNATTHNWKDIILKVEDYQPPQVKMQKVFWDIDKNESTRQIEFMTRQFLISAPIEKIAWKLTREMVKIQDYTCMGAEMKQGEKTIKAYFTSEIPVSIGPADYSGLPGLILAVEINGETAFLATSIDLSPPDESVLILPDKGSKMSQGEFDKILQEKGKEWKETRSERGTGKK